MDANDEVNGIEHLSIHECWDALRSADIGRLAVIIDDHPEIFPLTYMVDHGTVVFRSAEGSKVDGVRSGHPLAFEVDGYDRSTNRAWSAVIKGTAEEPRDIDEAAAAAMLPIFPWQAGEKNHFVRIVPDQISGRRFPVQPRGRRLSSISGEPDVE
ncbi:pyridoxamine 5'-phosphate oxidase family protein [Paeniglutamicibacter antarcticus]|uniref:Pyridoxamine 5'-phosphate oxidase family protein n=1 Tax=Arthrobacter terrae TaxID=2935737 RepID=A0A931G639_9MICC|nr:pyridoxamine 5'-phosphate oxidase family protein [Arthrobacter terrae]MBG0740623.1 pyridoxamine 5'-phosphate oxidase family protein [Arthrobacter terrae]